MAVFTRTSKPPQYQSHRSYKRFLRFDFQFRCAYCEVTEGYLHGPEAFGADHFRPYKHYPELDCTYDNLYYCCNRCNSYKGISWPSEEESALGLGFADPCREDPYVHHIALQVGGEAVPITQLGKYTLRVIRLDREECRRFRRKRESVQRRIQEYREALKAHQEPSMLVDVVRQALAEAEAEWMDVFSSEHHDG